MYTLLLQLPFGIALVRREAYNTEEEAEGARLGLPIGFEIVDREAASGALIVPFGGQDDGQTED